MLHYLEDISATDLDERHVDLARLPVFLEERIWLRFKSSLELFGELCIAAAPPHRVSMSFNFTYSKQYSNPEEEHG